MTINELRTFYTAAALQGLIAKYGIIGGDDISQGHVNNIAKSARRYADAVLSQETGGHIQTQING